MKKFMKKAAILAAMAMIAQLVVLPGMVLAAEGGHTGATIGWGDKADGLGIAKNAMGNQQLGWAEGNNLAAAKVEIPAEEAVAPVEEPVAAPTEGEAAATPAEGEAVAAPAEGEAAVAPAEGEAAVAPAEGEAAVVPTEKKKMTPEELAQYLEGFFADRVNLNGYGFEPAQN